jgi:hypothetical protein
MDQEKFQSEPDFLEEYGSLTTYDDIKKLQDLLKPLMYVKGFNLAGFVV